MATSLPKTAPMLFRLPASWETEINLQSRYPGGIFVTKIGVAESSACRDGGAVNAIIPARITRATSSKVILFIVVPPSGRLRFSVYARLMSQRGELLLSRRFRDIIF